MPWSCFLITETTEARRWLRRYASGSTCPAGEHQYHDARVLLDEVPLLFGPDGDTWWTEPSTWPREDSRWPTHCACGYAFQPEDAWQLSSRRLYVRPDTGERYTSHEVPIGAMWESYWLESMGRGPDGRCLSVMTPGGEWNIDLPSASGGPGWTRTGTPPMITARPSIHVIGKYHGFLTDGVLSDDLDGRSYP